MDNKNPWFRFAMEDYQAIENLKNLISECKEISNIFGAIVSKADKKQNYNE
ncbi:MAG: hypothetical protein ACTSO2_19835 [Promethearchaeota archaeon]